MKSISFGDELVSHKSNIFVNFMHFNRRPATYTNSQLMQQQRPTTSVPSKSHFRSITIKQRECTAARVRARSFASFTFSTATAASDFA